MTCLCQDDMEGVPSRVSKLVKALGQAILGPGRRHESEPRVPVQQFVELYWTTDDGLRHQQTVEVRSTSPKCMGILVPKPLPVNQMVMILRAEDEPIKAEIKHCRRDTDGYHAGLELLPQEHRRFERQPVNEPATLHWSEPHGERRSSQVVIRDATPAGVQVEVPCRVPSACLVRLSHEDWRYLGFTCYCTPKEDRYLVGIQFSKDPYHKGAREYRG